MSPEEPLVSPLTYLQLKLLLCTAQILLNRLPSLWTARICPKPPLSRTRYSFCSRSSASYWFILLHSKLWKATLSIKEVVFKFIDTDDAEQTCKGVNDTLVQSILVNKPTIESLAWLRKVMEHKESITTPWNLRKDLPHINGSHISQEVI